MLSPKRVKWRKQHKGRRRGPAKGGSELHFGEFGLQAVDAGAINSRQIEAARIAMTRSVKRGGQVWIRVFPHKPITKKAAETRMGSGKGSVEYWAAMIKPGRILFEMGGISRAEAFEALRLAGHKLPLKCRLLDKDLEVTLKKVAKEQREARKLKPSQASA